MEIIKRTAYIERLLSAMAALWCQAQSKGGGWQVASVDREGFCYIGPGFFSHRRQTWTIEIWEKYHAPAKEMILAADAPNGKEKLAF